MSFIENLTADSLNLPAEEFERYVTGQAVPPGGYDQGASEGLRVMYSNLAMLSDLRQRQERLAAGALYLRQEIIGFRDSVSREVESAISRTPLAPCSYKIPADLDVRFVPAFLRDTVVRELDTEGLLLQLEGDGQDEMGFPAHRKEVPSSVDMAHLASGDPLVSQDAQLLESSRLPPPLQPTVLATSATSVAEVTCEPGVREAEVTSPVPAAQEA